MQGCLSVCGYQTKFNNSESDLADHGVRKYDYITGRFMAVDPLWEKYRAFNTYQYAANNPMIMADRNGKHVEVEITEKSTEQTGAPNSPIRLRYSGGKFFRVGADNELGEEYKGNNAFASQILRALNRISEIDNVLIQSQFNQLINSKETHSMTERNLSPYDDFANTIEPTIPENLFLRKPTGSTILLNLNQYVNSPDAGSRDIGVVVAHELLGHAYYYDSGNYDMDNPETQAVNIENIARIYLGNGQYPMRTHHERNAVPGLWIHTIPYMSK